MAYSLIREYNPREQEWREVKWGKEGGNQWRMQWRMSCYAPPQKTISKRQSLLLMATMWSQKEAKWIFNQPPPPIYYWLVKRAPRRLITPVFPTHTHTHTLPWNRNCGLSLLCISMEAFEQKARGLCGEAGHSISPVSLGKRNLGYSEWNRSERRFGTKPFWSSSYLRKKKNLLNGKRASLELMCYILPCIYCVVKITKN